ncbi:MAG TPA: BtpA/SgcQ family protein, partial [Rubricoccaceae bacterium]
MPHRLARLFSRPVPIVAVIHAGPSPGVPGAADVRASVDRAVAEARTLIALGVDGLLVENAHDVPAVAEAEIGHEVVAYLTRVAAAVKRHAGRVPVGVRVMEDSGRVALAIAHGAG